MSAHTPTPLFLVARANGIKSIPKVDIHGKDAHGLEINVAEFVPVEYASEIVRAVNSHEALLETLKNVLEADANPDSVTSLSNGTIKMINLAIAQAEGK